MPTIFNVDHKLIAVPVLAVTAAAALYSAGRLWALSRRRRRENVYETAKRLNDCLLLHYGSPDEIMRWDFGPKADVHFPKRCAELCIKYCREEQKLPSRALDIGCGVGRSTFELTHAFNEVIGIDINKSFIETCNLLKEKGYLKYSIITEGELTQDLDAVVDKNVDRSKASFLYGDACNMPLDIGEFGCVLAANLLCHLYSPNEFFDRLPNLVSHGGILVLTSPYLFSTQITPKENWLGGWLTNNGTPVTGFDCIIEKLSPCFELLMEEELPFVLRETDRKYQWTVSHATIWRRK